MSRPDGTPSPLDRLLAGRIPDAVVVDPWDGGGCRTSAYLDPAAVADGLAVAARAIVVRPGLASQVTAEPEVLVLETDHGPLIIPGGRREPGETLEQTLHRELLEEAGWSVTGVRQVGFVHLRRLGPWRDGQPYPYQQFLFAIYAAIADRPRPDVIVASPTEHFVSAAFLPVAKVRALDLAWPPRLHQRLFLEAAVRALDRSRHGT